MSEDRIIGNLYENIVIYSEKSGNNTIIKFYDPIWDNGYCIIFSNNIYNIYYNNDKLFESEFLENAVMCIDEMHQINNK